MNNRTIEIGSELESLLRSTFSNTFVAPGPWLIIVGVILAVVVLAICVVIYLQKPREEDEESRPALTIKLRGPASNLIRNRRPNAYPDAGRPPDRPSLPSPAVPARAHWEASDAFPQAERERALEAESPILVEEEPLVSQVPSIPPIIEPLRTPPPISIASGNPRKPFLLPAPAVLTAAVPNFVFERVQSTTTMGSLAFGLQQTTLSPPRLPRIVAPPSPVIPPRPEPTPEAEPLLTLLPDPDSPTITGADVTVEAEVVPEPAPAPAKLLPPLVEVRTEPLPPPPPPIPEICTEPLPPAAGEVVEDEALPHERSILEAPDAEPNPQPPTSEAIFLRPSPSVPLGEEPPERLTPFQRMKRRRAVPTLDKNGRATYITYTFEPDPDQGSDDKPGT